MEIRLLDETFNEQVEILKYYSFQSRYNDAKQQDFKKWIERCDVIGVIEEEQLIGQLFIYPLNLTLFGINYQMGGIGFVCSYPEHRNRGIAKKLMLASLEQMRVNKQVVSVLAPFSVSFYRYFGWELFSDVCTFKFDGTQWPNFPKQQLKVKRCVIQAVPKAVKQFYNDYAQRQHGAMVRDEVWWQRLIAHSNDTFIAYHEVDGNIDGFVRYTLDKTTMHIDELIVSNHASEQQLWLFLEAHSSTISCVTGTVRPSQLFSHAFENPQIQKKIVQPVMLRIVDVAAFLQQLDRTAIQIPFSLAVTDLHAPWNQHTWYLAEHEILKVTTAADVTLSIQQLTSIVSGYLSVEEMAYLYGWSTNEKNRLAQLSKKNIAYFTEYF